MNLRKHVREIQLLENKAAEKAGARFATFEMGEVLKTKTRKDYIESYISALIGDIMPELVKSTTEGVKLFNQINK